MNVTFYATASDSRKIQKSLTLIHSSDTVKLKEDTSIVNPVLTVTIFDNYYQVNYIYIKEFHRYYFVTDIKSVANSVIEIHCHADVLMSNASSILNMRAIIKRNTSVYNNYLVDPQRKVLCYPTQTILNFPKSKQFNTSLQYVLTVAGGKGSV